MAFSNFQTVLVPLLMTLTKIRGRKNRLLSTLWTRISLWNSPFTRGCAALKTRLEGPTVLQFMDTTGVLETVMVKGHDCTPRAGLLFRYNEFNIPLLQTLTDQMAPVAPKKVLLVVRAEGQKWGIFIRYRENTYAAYPVPRLTALPEFRPVLYGNICLEDWL